MRIGIPAEIYPGETRVGATPETVKKLVAGARHSVIVESGAGVSASIPDAEYVAAGASLACAADVYKQADIILKVRRPEETELPLLRSGSIVGLVKELTGGEGADRVFEAVGQQWPLDLAGELTRVRGRLLIAGYHQDGRRSVDMQLWNWRGLDVVNAHERDPSVYLEGMREAVAAVAAGRLDPRPLYTHRFRLDQLGEAMEALRNRPDGFLKALVLT